MSFVIGVDIYDCVLVINDFAVLETFTRPSIALGNDVSIGTGPLIGASNPVQAVNWSEFGHSVFSYLKSRGVNTRIQLDGSILTERANENERFYRSPISVLDILASNVGRDVPELRPLTEMLKAAEGRKDFDAQLIAHLSNQPSPGDMTIESTKPAPVSPSQTTFGVPDAQDPDPFGVLALEMAGLEIREAGTKSRPASNQFEYSPTLNSPLFPQFHHRQSFDTFFSRSTRGSHVSSKIRVTERTRMTDASTQTGIAGTPETIPSPTQSDDSHEKPSVHKHSSLNENEDFTKIDTTPIRHLSYEDTLSRNAPTQSRQEVNDVHDIATPGTWASSTCVEEEHTADEEDDYEGSVVFEVATTTTPPRAVISQAAQVIQAKSALVNIPKRIPPPLPLRSPARLSRNSKSSLGDFSALGSPLKQSFTDPASPTDDNNTERCRPSASSIPEYASKAVGEDRACNTVSAENPTDHKESPKSAFPGQSSVGGLVQEVPDSKEIYEATANISKTNNDSLRLLKNERSSSTHTTMVDATAASSPTTNMLGMQSNLIKEVQQEVSATYGSEDSDLEEFKVPSTAPAATEAPKEDEVASTLTKPQAGSVQIA